MDSNTLAHVASTGGIIGTVWWAGAGAGISILTTGPLMAYSADPLSAVKVWANLYKRGAFLGPKVGMMNSVALGFAAYHRFVSGQPWMGVLTGALLGIAIIPWTLIVMLPTNNELVKASEGKRDITWAQARDLMGKWQGMNLFRGVFPAVGAAIALWEVMQS